MPSRFTTIGDLRLSRIGFGAYHLTGPGCWGPPGDPQLAISVLRHAVDCGVSFFDTADSYGPHVSEELICRALYPYRDGVVVATKGGLVHSAPHRWTTLGHPDYLRYSAEMSLRRLQVDCIDVYFLHRVDPAFPLEDQLGTLKSLQDEGKIRNIGLSQVTANQIMIARQYVRVSCVQNLYNIAQRESEEVVQLCEQLGITFVAWLPLGGGRLHESHRILRQLALQRSTSWSVLALGWLLNRSPAVVPIPGTSNVAHLEANCAAIHSVLGDADIAALNDL